MLLDLNGNDEDDAAAVNLLESDMGQHHVSELLDLTG